MENIQSKLPQGELNGDEKAVRGLYQRLLEAWNARDAARMASLFDEHAHLIGFDGSQMTGQAAIETEIGSIFADHSTATYVGIIREVNFLTPDVALLNAVAGMIPPGQSKINPAVNTIHSLVAMKRDARWSIALYQNTPAQYHGRPELAQQLTEELQQLV